MSMHGPCMCSVLSSEGLSWLWRRPDRTLKLPVWIKVPPRWLFAPSLSQLLANDPSIISDTQSADKWRDLDEIKDNCNISLIDRPRQFLPARGAETKKWTESFWALSKETFGKKIYIQSDIQNRNYNLLIHQPITVKTFFWGWRSHGQWNFQILGALVDMWKKLRRCSDTVLAPCLPSMSITRLIKYQHTPHFLTPTRLYTRCLLPMSNTK